MSPPTASFKRHINKHQRRHSIPGCSSSSSLSNENGGAMSEISVEVRAISSPQGALKDEIMIVMPLPEKELDDDPLYYYPPSSPKKKGANVYEDEEDTESESDSDEDEEEDTPGAVTDHNLRRPRSIMLNSGPTTTTTVKKINDKSCSSPEEYSFMEELMQTLDTIFGCSYGGCLNEARCAPVLKSSLRRKGSAGYDESVNRSVSFTKLEIREFNMTLGNHPSAVTGPPVMLDWDSRPTREAIVDLDMYEKARQPRRNRKELKLSFEARRGILENERGFTVEEVKKAWSEALKIRKQRQETRLQAPHQRMMDEIYESACRKYNRLFEWNARLCQ